MKAQVQLIARVEPEIRAALNNLKETKGILIEHQIRMGCLMWLESQGIEPLKPKKAGGK